MKLKILAAALALGCAAAAPAFAADGQFAVPKSTDAWAQMMWDFTQNPTVLRDPKAFVPWSQAVTEPSFYTALGMQSMDPSNWLRMGSSMIDPRVYGAWMPFMTDPNLYMKWLAASMDPNFYTALLTQFSDPGKMMRWAMAPMDPKLLGMAMQPLNPSMYLKWMMSPLDPRALQMGMAPMNPNWYLGWAGSMMNPASYGDLWKGFLSAPGVVPGIATPAVPPGGTTLFNPFDPATWSQFTAVPGMTAPAAPAFAPAAPGGTAAPATK